MNLISSCSVEDELYSFGRGEFGQLGLGTMMFVADAPVAVGHFRKGRVTHVTCGENHTALITGKIYTLLNKSCQRIQINY